MPEKKKSEQVRLKTDGAALPTRPPADLISPDEKKAYTYLLDKVRRHAYAEAVDLPALVLASQRLAYARDCRATVADLRKNGTMYQQLPNGTWKPHPALAELRAAESALNTSLGTLYLNPRSRGNARGKGEVDPHDEDRGSVPLR